MVNWFQVLMVLGVSVLHAGWEYPGCGEITDADFKQVSLIGGTAISNALVTDPQLNEPLELALVPDGSGAVDIFFTERAGKLKFYDASENSVSILGEFPTAITTSAGEFNDMGFKGIALDPNFMENGWIYISYPPTGLGKEVLRITRFTFDGKNIDLSSEKIILDIPVNYSQRWHIAGSMSMDAYGDLWITVGPNCIADPNNLNENNRDSSCESTTSNTNEFRGSVLRIHPEPNGSYSIPKGNFWEYYSMKYENEGDIVRASEIRDPNKVLKEIYVKGLRNPWTINIEPVKRTLVWGENGINRGGLHDEHNYTKIPGFFGYPYFAGHPDVNGCGANPEPCATTTYQNVYNITGNRTKTWGLDAKEPLNPVNNSKWNTGIQNLPPAIPAVHNFRQSSAMTGPIYRYDGDLKSKVKFPPHFNGAWFLFDFMRQPGNNKLTKVVKVNEETMNIDQEMDVFKSSTFDFRGGLDYEFGPDGAMYIVFYGSGWFTNSPTSSIARIEYTGTCHPETPKLDVSYYPPPGYGCMRRSDVKYDPTALAHDEMACGSVGLIASSKSSKPQIIQRGRKIEIQMNGEYKVELNRLDGTLVKSFAKNGFSNIFLGNQNPSGIYLIKIKSSVFQFTEKIIL